MPSPLLTLETLEPDRPTIRIDGAEYELALPDDFGLIESARLARLMRQATEAQKAAEDLPADASLEGEALDGLERVLDGTLAMILRAPADVLARLNSSQKVAVIAAFGPAMEDRAALSAKGPRSDRSTSARRSRSSKRPTGRRIGTACRSAS